MENAQIDEILKEDVHKWTTDVAIPCRTWRDSKDCWIADCQVLGLTTFSNTEESAKNSLINRIRLDLALRSKGMN